MWVYQRVGALHETEMKEDRAPRQVVWASTNPPGVEYCTVQEVRSGWVISGSVVRRFGQHAGVVSYRIEADQGWRTRRAAVELILGGARRVQELEVRDSSWSVGGKKEPRLAGCLDVDLEASPVTNTLPIKRCGAKVGEKVEVTAAWVRFPSLKVEPLSQSYERLAKRKYRYRSGSGFTSEIEVDDFGLVKRYGNYWVAVEGG